MECGGVTLLTQEGCPGSQQRVVNGTVRPVALPAVLGSRRVFEEVGAALLGVTVVAAVVQCRLNEHGFRTAAVRIVAVDTGGTPFIYRVARAHFCLAAHVGVALEADFRLD